MEEMHTGRGRRSGAWSFQVHNPSRALMCSATWKLPESHSRVFMTQSPAPFSSLKIEGRAESFHPLFPGLVW